MSYAIDIFTPTGTKKGTHQLPDLFGDEQINQWLVHEYVVMYLANQRQGNAKAKTRAEVRASGRKLFKQKGTGRARVGSASSPIRKKWGAAFGPRPERTYAKKMNQKSKQKALLSALLLQLQHGSVQGLEEISFAAPKTKEAVAVLTALKVNKKKTLIVLETHNDVVRKSRRNIPGVSVTTLSLLNPYEIMTHSNMIITKQALEDLPQRFHLLTH